MKTKAQGRNFWIVVTSVVALVVLIILLMTFTNKESFNPDKHICLEEEFCCNFCVKENVKQLTDEKRSYLEDCDSLEKSCVDWRDKTPCELDPNVCVQTSFIEALNIIESNCGSTFLTKKYGEEGWYIFTEICKEGNYCKTNYIKLEDCLI